MIRFRKSLLWAHAAALTTILMVGVLYTGDSVPDIPLLVETVHRAVTTWFYPEPLLTFLVLALLGWLLCTFRFGSSIGYAIGSVLSLVLSAWWMVLLSFGDLLQRLPEFFLFGSVLAIVAALAPFRPVSLFILIAVRYGILPVMTLHRVLIALNPRVPRTRLEKIPVVSDLTRHAARSRTDFLLANIQSSLSLRIKPSRLFRLVASVQNEYDLGLKAVKNKEEVVAIHHDRLSMIYSTLILVENHADSDYPSEQLHPMFGWSSSRHVAECYQVFDASMNTKDRICASSNLFRGKQWSLLLYGGMKYPTYPVLAVQLRAAQEILMHLEDATGPEYREVLARQNQLMRDLHLIGSLSDGCVLSPTSPLSLSKRAENHDRLEKSGFSAPVSFASLPIFDGTPGLRLATFFLAFLIAWFFTDEVGFELGDPLRRFSTAYLPESDPRRIAQDDRLTEIQSLSGQPLVARVERSGKDESLDGHVRIDPKTYDVEAFTFPEDLVSSSRPLIDSYQAPNGFNIVTASSADPQTNRAHYFLPQEGTEHSDWRTIHAPVQTFELGTILDARWLTPDMQCIVGSQGMCLYQPSMVADGLHGYEFAPYLTPRVSLSDALLTDTHLHLVFESAGEVHHSKVDISSIKKTFDPPTPSLQGLFSGSRVLPRFEIGEVFDIHPGPQDSIFVQGSQGALLQVADNIHIIRWGQLPQLRNPELVFLGDYALAFDQSHLLLHRSSEIAPSSWWATKNLTSGDGGSENEVSLFSEPFPDCFLAIHELDNQSQLTLLVHKKSDGNELGRVYRFRVGESGKINDGELFLPDVVDFSVSSDGQDCAITARFSQFLDDPDDERKYEILLTFSSESAATLTFDHEERDRLAAFQKFHSLAPFDNRHQLAVRSPMPKIFVDQKLALSSDLRSNQHHILNSSGNIQAYSENRLSPVGPVESLSPFPSGSGVSVDFFTDDGINHVLTVQPNHQVDLWRGDTHQTFPWHLSRWGSSRPNVRSVALAPGIDDFIISDGESLRHHGVSGGWRLLDSPLNDDPVPADQLFSLSSDANRASLLFSIVDHEASSALLEVLSGGGDVQSHQLPSPIDQANRAWILSPAESPKFVYRSSDSGVAKWFSWDKTDPGTLRHLADPSEAPGKVIDLCDINSSPNEGGLLILGEGSFNFVRNSGDGWCRQPFSHPLHEPFKPSQLVDSSSGVWALYTSGDETRPTLVTPSWSVVEKQPALLTSSVTTDPGRGFLGLSRTTREPVRFGVSTEKESLLPNARFDFEADGLEILHWIPGQDHLHLVTLSSGQNSQRALFTLDGFGRLQQSVPDLRFEGNLQTSHLIGSKTHIFTDQWWYTLSGTQDFQARRPGLWMANSFPGDNAGLAWRVRDSEFGDSEGIEPAGKAIGLGALEKLQLPGAGSGLAGNPSRTVPLFQDPDDNFYLGAQRGMYRWGGVAQGFTSVALPVPNWRNVRTWLRSSRGGAPIAVVPGSAAGPAFYRFDFDTNDFIDLEIDLNSWSQDSPEHAWAVDWRGSDWFADVENLRLVTKQGDGMKSWGGWSTGTLDDSPAVWNVQGREYLLDKSGRLLKLNVGKGQWETVFSGESKFESIHPIPQRSSDVASEQTQFVAKIRNSNDWKHLQLGQSEIVYFGLSVAANPPPTYDSDRFLGLTIDGERIIEYKWQTRRLQERMRPAPGAAQVLAKASGTSVWVKQGSLLREISLSSGQWNSEEIIETKQGSIEAVPGENNLILFQDRASREQTSLVRSGQPSRPLTETTADLPVVIGWDAVAFSETSSSKWTVSNGETDFQVPHKEPYELGDVQATFVEDNNLLVVSNLGVSRFARGDWLDVTRSGPVKVGVVDSRWCYLQDGKLLDQNRRLISEEYSDVRSMFSSAKGTVVVDGDWRATWHDMKSGESSELIDSKNYLFGQSDEVFDASQFPPEGKARFLTWSSQGKSYLSLSDKNQPQDLSGLRPMIWLSPSHRGEPVFDPELNRIKAKSTSSNPELVNFSSDYFATSKMLFREGSQIQEPPETITVRESRSSSEDRFLLVPDSDQGLHFELTESGGWSPEPELAWTEQSGKWTSATVKDTRATLIRSEHDDLTGYFTVADGRPQKVQIKSFVNKDEDNEIGHDELLEITSRQFKSDKPVPDSFCDRIFLQFDSGDIGSFAISQSSSIQRRRSSVVPLVDSGDRDLRYEVQDGQIGIWSEGEFLPMDAWSTSPTLVQGGQKSWGDFIPEANNVVSSSHWLRSSQLPIDVEWIDGIPQVQRGSQFDSPSSRTATSISDHHILGPNPRWEGEPGSGMLFQGKPLGKLTRTGFESHLRMQRGEFVPVSYKGSLGVIRMVDNKLWIQSDQGWQEELAPELKSKVVEGPSSKVSLRPNANRNGIVDGGMLRWDPLEGSIGSLRGNDFYALKLADFNSPNPFLCARPSGFGYGRGELVVFSYTIAGEEYQSQSADLSLNGVLDLLGQKPAEPAPASASVPNRLPPSKIQDVNKNLVRSDDGQFALAWHLVDRVQPGSATITVSRGNGPSYFIETNGDVQSTGQTESLPIWSEDDALPFRPVSGSSTWELQLPTTTGVGQWVPAGLFDRGNFELLQLDKSSELLELNDNDDIWIIQRGGLRLGWSQSAGDFVAAPDEPGASAKEYTYECGSYELSLSGGELVQILHSDTDLLVFDEGMKENPYPVTAGGWISMFEPQDIQYVESVSVQQKGDPFWCVQLRSDNWVTINEDSKCWKPSGPLRDTVDPPELQFGLLAGLSRKQIRENWGKTPLDWKLGVFEFEIPDRVRAGFDQQRRFIVTVGDQSYEVDPSFRIRLSDAEISDIQPDRDPANSNLVLGLSSTALRAGGAIYEFKDERLGWSPNSVFSFQESDQSGEIQHAFQEVDQSGVFEHNLVKRAFFTTFDNQMLTTYKGGFVVRGPSALSICPDDSVTFQRDLYGVLRASRNVECEFPIATEYDSATNLEIMGHKYVVSGDGWVQPGQGIIQTDGRLPNSRSGWIGVYPNGVAEIVGDRSRFLARDQTGISRPTIPLEDLPCQVSTAFHLNGGLFIENSEQLFAVELSEHLELGVEGFRSARHDWSPTYQDGLTISTQSIQSTDGSHDVNVSSWRRPPRTNGALEDPAPLDTKNRPLSFRSHSANDVATVQVRSESDEDELHLHVLGSSLARIDFGEEAGNTRFSKMYKTSSAEVATSSAGTVYVLDGSDWLHPSNGEVIREDSLGSRWVDETFDAFSGTFDWTLWEDPNGVLRYSSNLHDSLNDRVLSKDLLPEWPWDRLVASGFDLDTYPYWSSTELHLRRSTGSPKSAGLLSNQKNAFTHARQKVYSDQGSAHVPVECAFPSPPSIPSRGFPLSASLQDGSVALDIEGKAPVLIDLSRDLRYSVDFGDGPDTPVASADRIDNNLWILNQSGQLRWVPIREEWLRKLVEAGQ